MSQPDRQTYARTYVPDRPAHACMHACIFNPHMTQGDMRRGRGRGELAATIIKEGKRMLIPHFQDDDDDDGRSSQQLLSATLNSIFFCVIEFPMTDWLTDWLTDSPFFLHDVLIGVLFVLCLALDRLIHELSGIELVLVCSPLCLSVCLSACLSVCLSVCRLNAKPSSN